MGPEVFPLCVADMFMEPAVCNQPGELQCSYDWPLVIYHCYERATLNGKEGEDDIIIRP